MKYVYDDWPDHKKPKVYRSQNRFDMSVGMLERICAVRPRVSSTASTR